MPPHEAYEDYAVKHNALCVKFTEEILDREGYADLQSEPGMRKAQFASRLEEMP